MKRRPPRSTRTDHTLSLHDALPIFMKKLKSFLVGVVLFLVVVAGIAAWLVLPWPFLLGLAVLLGLWMVITRRGRQARSVTGIGVSTLPGRLGASAVVVHGKIGRG